MARPVPTLEHAHNVLELPFWIWTASDPVRRPLYLHRQHGRLSLSPNRTPSADRMWSLSDPRRDHDQAVTTFLALAKNKIRIRPRALMTTLYLRHFASDFFVPWNRRWILRPAYRPDRQAAVATKCGPPLRHCDGDDPFAGMGGTGRSPPFAQARASASRSHISPGPLAEERGRNGPI